DGEDRTVKVRSTCPAEQSPVIEPIESPGIHTDDRGALASLQVADQQRKMILLKADRSQMFTIRRQSHFGEGGRTEEGLDRQRLRKQGKSPECSGDDNEVGNCALHKYRRFSAKLLMASETRRTAGARNPTLKLRVSGRIVKRESDAQL